MFGRIAVIAVGQQQHHLYGWNTKSKIVKSTLPKKLRPKIFRRLIMSFKKLVHARNDLYLNRVSLSQTSEIDQVFPLY